MFVPLHPLSKNRGVEQLVARQAHNLEVARSNPASATKKGAIQVGGSLYFYSFLLVVHSFTRYTMLMYGMPVFVSKPISQVRLFE